MNLTISAIWGLTAISICTVIGLVILVQIDPSNATARTATILLFLGPIILGLLNLLKSAQLQEKMNGHLETHVEQALELAKQAQPTIVALPQVPVQITPVEPPKEI